MDTTTLTAKELKAAYDAAVAKRAEFDDAVDTAKKLWIEAARREQLELEAKRSAYGARELAAMSAAATARHSRAHGILSPAPIVHGTPNVA